MTQDNLEIKNGLPYPFGTTLLNGGINFAVYSDKAQKLFLCFSNKDSPYNPYKEIELSPVHNKTGQVWHIWIKGLSSDTIYSYKVLKEGETTSTGLLLDPYATSLFTPSIWNKDTDKTYHPLGRINLDQTFNWEGDKQLHIPMKDLVIYEMHVRGFTRHTSSEVKYPGTYLGIIEKIPYLKELGVNAIELMPIHEFNEKEAMQINPRTKEKLCNYFGYSTVNFFTPMSRFANQAEQSIVEFKTMVKELHKNGIEVILDVVFNHTFEGNENGPTISFRGFSPNTYYMIDGAGNYLNFSGCGNTINSNHPVVVQMILDALHYWVIEMHVDGFRFDLSSIMTRAENGAPSFPAPLVDAISRDPILANTKLIAEPWDAGGLYQVGSFTVGSNRWSEWNGKFRDIVRRFIKGTSDHKTAFATAICGSQDLYGYGRSPQCSINFVTAHDGFSLADLVTYNEKHNELNGEENRDGFNYNDSWNCGFEGHSGNKKIIALRERQIRNFILALMVSQGVPMILMGDEYAHTRNGNNNTWCQDNDLNWFLWDHLDFRPGFLRFFQKLIHFRNNSSFFNRDTFLNEQDITWHGVRTFQPEWENDNRFVAFTLNSPEQGPELYIAFNASHLSLTVTLPPLDKGKAWYWIVNTHNAAPLDFYENDDIKLEFTHYRLHSYSAIMLKAH